MLYNLTEKLTKLNFNPFMRRFAKNYKYYSYKFSLVFHYLSKSFFNFNTYANYKILQGI